MKNLCNAIPVLYKSPIYKKDFIDISNEMLITRRYFIGMTQKMKLINYRMGSLGYYDYVNVIFEDLALICKNKVDGKSWRIETQKREPALSISFVISVEQVKKEVNKLY